MLEKEWEALRSDSPADIFLRELSHREGHPISNLTNEQIREVITLWNPDPDTLRAVEVHTQNGRKEGLLALLAPEKNAFPSGSSVAITKSARYVHTNDYHDHDYFEIECILEGEAVHKSLLGNYSLLKGDLVLIPPHVRHDLDVIECGTVVNLGIRSSTFRTDFKDIFERNLGIASYFEQIMYKSFNSEVILQKSLDDFLFELLLMMYQKQQTYPSDMDMINNHLATCFLYHLFEYSDHDLLYDITQSSNLKASQMKRYITEHCENITLEQLADHFCMSKSYVSRYIKENLRKNYSSILEEARMNKAKEYLIKTDLPIIEISQKVGYASQSYFISVFHRRCGISPLQFRLIARYDSERTKQ